MLGRLISKSHQVKERLWRYFLSFQIANMSEESFLLMEGLTSLRPNKSAKYEWLIVVLLKSNAHFMYMAEKINHPWVLRLNRDLIDIGSGKRLIVKGDFLDPKYQITVPVSFER